MKTLLAFNLPQYRIVTGCGSVNGKELFYVEVLQQNPIDVEAGYCYHRLYYGGMTYSPNSSYGYANKGFDTFEEALSALKFACPHYPITIEDEIKLVDNFS